MDIREVVIHKAERSTRTGLTLGTNHANQVVVQGVAQGGAAYAVFYPDCLGSVLLEINGNAVKGHDEATETLKASVGDIKLKLEPAYREVIIHKADRSTRTGLTLNMNPAKQVFIQDVVQGGAAYSAINRVFIGYILLEINGKAVTSHEEAMKTLKASVGQIKLKLAREPPLEEEASCAEFEQIAVCLGACCIAPILNIVGAVIWNNGNLFLGFILLSVGLCIEGGAWFYYRERGTSRLAQAQRQARRLSRASTTEVRV
jgi:S1-C subfamily serine protease